MSRALTWATSVATLLGLLAVATPASAQEAVEVVSDIRYATHGGVSLLLDAYLPAGEGPFPAVVVIPGGRWVEIDKTKHADVPTYFAQHGIAAFAVNYRSALEFPYPAAVEDVSAAIRWVRAHAAEYELDANELGAIGVSSGGHLAALVAARGSGPLDRGDRVNVVASWSGPMDLRPLVDSEDANVRSAVRDFLGCSATEPCTELAREASPITYVDPSDPPMVLVNAPDEIIPLSQAESMAEALEAAGVQSRLTIAQGGHGAGYGGGNKILDQVIPFVRAWVAGREAPAVGTEQTEGAQGGGDDGGKGQEAASPAASASPAAPSPSPVGGSKQQVAAADVSTDDSGPSVLIVAIAMIALVLVIVQVFVIARLRRRIAGLVSGLSGDEGPSAVGVEGT